MPRRDPLLAEAADLRARCLRRVPGFRDTRAARRELAGMYAALLPVAQERGRVEAFRTGGQLRAVLVAGPVEDPWMGGRLTRVLVDQDARSPRGRRWLGDALGELLGEPPEDLELTLAAPYREHLRRLAPGRSHVHCALLLGSPRRARRGLGAVDVQARLDAADVAVRPLASEAEIEQVLRWKTRWFSAHPEYGAHCARPAYLEAERQEMREELAKGAHEMRLFTRRGRPAGYFGFCVAPSATWGRCASLDLMLPPPLQARGLGRAAYALMVERMLALGLDGIRGGTSQPGVLALARQMRRPTLAWVLAAGEGPFGLEHFLGG